MPLILEQKFNPFNFECDSLGRMTPGSVLRRVQEISSAHCGVLNITSDVFEKTGTAFLLSRLSLVINRTPAIGEQIRIQTRAYGMRRALFHRVTSLYAADGSLLCETDTRWVLVDVASRRIHRSMPVSFPPVFTDEEITEAHPMKMPKPDDDLCLVAELSAGYTVCDTNGHMNNTYYADVICDLVPLEKIHISLPRQILICYHSEIPEGERYSILHTQKNDGDYFVGSQNGKKKSFESYMIW